MLISQKCYAFTLLTHGLSECDKYFISIMLFYLKELFKKFCIITQKVHYCFVCIFRHSVHIY